MQNTNSFEAFDMIKMVTSAGKIPDIGFVRVK